MSFDPTTYGALKKEISKIEIPTGGNQRKCFDLDQYQGETTEGDTETIGGAAIDLCFAGGGGITVFGDEIEQLREELNKSENTSVLVWALGDPVELFPSYVLHIKESKNYGFVFTAVMNGTVNSFLIELDCHNTNSISITAYVT